MSRDGFTRSRRRCVLRTSSLRRSRKFALSCPTTPVSMLTRIEMLHAFSSGTRLPSSTSGGSQRPLFFFHPNRRTALHMVGTEILSPCSLSHSSQWRFRAAPSFSASCLHRGTRGTYLPGRFPEPHVPFEGGHREAEGPNDILPGDAAVHGGQHLPSQFERVPFHGPPRIRGPSTRLLRPPMWTPLVPPLHELLCGVPREPRRRAMEAYPAAAGCRRRAGDARSGVPRRVDAGLLL